MGVTVQLNSGYVTDSRVDKFAVLKKVVAALEALDNKGKSA